MNIVSAIDKRGHQYIDVALPHAYKNFQDHILTPTIGFLTKFGGRYLPFAAISLVAYAAFRMLAAVGKTNGMQVGDVQVLKLKKHTEEEETVIPMNEPKTLQGKDVENVHEISVETISALEVLIGKIDTLKTREDIVSWLITYQLLSHNGSGFDVVQGTVASGLATALRLGIAGEDLAILDDSAVKAVIETLQELKKEGNLSLLNGAYFADSKAFQQIETRHHLEHAESYDSLGQMMANLSPSTRATLGWILSKPSPRFGEAALGSARIISKVAESTLPYGE